jgi:hypothetical protein
MFRTSNWREANSRDLRKAGVDDLPMIPGFDPLTPQEIARAFSASSEYPPVLSLIEAAGLVKLRPQTLKREVIEGLYAHSVVRGKPLRFWRDRFVAEVMQ